MLVIHHDENLEDGLPYAIELTRIMQKALSILIIYRRKVIERFEDFMIATTFAETSEFKTAKELITNDLRGRGIDYEERLRSIQERCNSVGVDFLGVNTSSENILSAIGNLTKGDSSIEMVLLSPSITQDGHISAKELQRLVKEISRPIVTMARGIKKKTA